MKRGGDFVVPLDGGNAVSLAVDGGMEKFATLVESMNLMGYQAATLGVNEVVLGQFMIKRYDFLAEFPLVSANVKIGDHLAESVALPTLDPIFVTGVTESETVGYGVSISDPVAAVERVMKGLPPDALLVVLAHTSRETADAIAALSPRSILVLGYSSLSTDLRARRPGGAIVAGLSGKGRHVIVTKWSSDIRRNIWRMNSYNVTTLGLNRGEDPAIAELVRSSL